MKKIMILGASVLQLPAILTAKEMGLYVIAVDMDKNAIGFKYSDVSEVISTIDVSGVIEVAKKHNINGVMTLASDMPMKTVAAVAKELKIVGVSTETALKATNKAFMRESLAEHDVPIPLFFRVSSKKDYLKAIKMFKNRCIVKPVDNSGSRGVFLIEDFKDINLIEDAFEYSKAYSRSGEIIVEEYMTGEEISVETLSIDNEVHVIAITDKITTGAPYFVEMGHSQPTHYNIEMKKRIVEVACMAVKAIGIKSGPAHTEMKITTDGPKVIEIGARLGGDNITTHLTPLSTGVDMVKCSIQIALGEKPSLDAKYCKGSAIRYFKTEVGILKSINGIESAKRIEGVKEINFVKAIDDEIGEINSSVSRIGFIITQGDTVEDAANICDKAMELIDIVVVKGE
ncbi:TPA: ATP-grasp domain-containing protein [Bacillus pacificus]|uniref:ATP-grasp domain-containing protein n=1 Tax=Bacillus cereus group sp. BcHK124 TaxID=3018094 RepID=UPI0022E34106|nr:ATP-grasp domain-containing protein [Bacillus cereus group sp. BcHK124]MDA1944377.1 ATP-grasp domain-containing protein [Bacillus cereus group sp. BcHK124]